MAVSIEININKHCVEDCGACQHTQDKLNKMKTVTTNLSHFIISHWDIPSFIIRQKQYLSKQGLYLALDFKELCEYNNPDPCPTSEAEQSFVGVKENSGISPLAGGV